MLTNVHPADVLADWSAYCAAHGMVLSFVPPDADAQELRVVSASGEQTAFIAHPDGALPVATPSAIWMTFCAATPKPRLTTFTATRYFAA